MWCVAGLLRGALLLLRGALLLLRGALLLLRGALLLLRGVRCCCRCAGVCRFPVWCGVRCELVFAASVC